MKNFKLTCSFLLWIALAAAHFNATAWEVTTGFGEPANKEASGGGGCAATVNIQKIVSPIQSFQTIAGIYLGRPFVKDPFCNVEEKILLSIDGKEYAIYGDSKNYEFKFGFLSRYKNPKESITVSIKHIKTLKKQYDSDTECTTFNRKVKLDISFKGTQKIVYGVTNGGCP